MIERQIQYPNYQFHSAEKTLAQISPGEMKSMERIPQGEIIDLVTEIGMFYGIPEKTYMKCIGIPAFRMDQQELDDISYGNQTGITLAVAVNPGKDSSFILVSDHFKSQEKNSLTHELIHCMRPIRSLRSHDHKKNRAHGVSQSEESVVTVLEMALAYKDVPLLIDEKCPKNDTLLRRILREKVVTAYADQVVALLALMQGTKRGGNPFTLEELSKRYFHDGIFFTKNLLQDLRNRVSPEDLPAYEKNFKLLTW